MPQFFFDLLNGGVVEKDEFGVDLHDTETAYLEAHRAAIEIWADARRQGIKPQYRCFQIRDCQDRIVFELPFSEALYADTNVHSSTPRLPDTGSDLETEVRQTLSDVTLGERHIASQRLRIERLQRMGADTALAKRLLKTFLETQVLHEYHHRVLTGELEEARG